MSPPDDKPPSSAPPSAGATQVIDLADVQLSLDEPSARGTAPPPLPREVIAAHVAPASHALPVGASGAPGAPGTQAPQEAPPRSTTFYGVVLLVVLAIGVGGGLIVALSLRKEPAAVAPASASGAATPASITIPVVEFDDSPDAGN